MQLSLQRLIDRWVGTALCAACSLWPRRREGPPGRPPAVRRILVILLSEMGSLVLALPMFQRLSQRYPGASVHVVLFERNRGMLDVLRPVPDDHVLTLRDTTLRAFVVDLVRVIRRLRALDLDAAIDCELFSRFGSVLAYLSGARLLAGFHAHTQRGLYRGSFINRPVLYNPHVHISWQFIGLVEAIETGGVPRAKRVIERGRPSVSPMTLSGEAREAARRALERKYPGADLNRLILVYPGGGVLPVRAWPVDGFTEVCARLCGDGCTVGVIGTPADTPLAKEILGGCVGGGCIDLTGYTPTICDLLLLLDLAALLITNDGGPAHLAALAEVPAVILYGPETPALYGSLSPFTSELFASVSCAPCLSAYNHKQSPCDGDNVCMKAISTEVVLREARRWLLECGQGRVQGLSGTAPLTTRDPDAVV